VSELSRIAEALERIALAYERMVIDAEKSSELAARNAASGEQMVAIIEQNRRINKQQRDN